MVISSLIMQYSYFSVLLCSCVWLTNIVFVSIRPNRMLWFKLLKAFLWELWKQRQKYYLFFFSLKKITNTRCGAQINSESFQVLPLICIFFQAFISQGAVCKGRANNVSWWVSYLGLAVRLLVIFVGVHKLNSCGDFGRKCWVGGS